MSASASPAAPPGDPGAWAAHLPAPARVRSVRRETSDTWTLELDPPGGRLAFAPGQFTMLYAFGAGEAPISISGDPARPERLVHTIRAVGAVTRALCAARPGDVIGARGPFGNPWPVEAAQGRDLVLVAGGIGLAPLRPVLYAALARRGELGRLVLLVGSRSPELLLYRDELEAWGRRDDLELRVTVDAAGGDWRGDVGVVTGLVRRARFDPVRTVAMVCGPEVMMRYVALELLGAGVAGESLFLSMERNMKCAVALCGHCQLGPGFVCKDGPVYAWPALAPLLAVREL